MHDPSLYAQLRLPIFLTWRTCSVRSNLKDENVSVGWTTYLLQKTFFLKMEKKKKRVRRKGQHMFLSVAQPWNCSLCCHLQWASRCAVLCVVCWSEEFLSSHTLSIEWSRRFCVYNLATFCQLTLCITQFANIFINKWMWTGPFSLLYTYMHIYVYIFKAFCFCVSTLLCALQLASRMFYRVCNLCLNPGVRWKGEMKRHYKGEIGSADKSTQRAWKAVCAAQVKLQMRVDAKEANWILLAFQFVEVWVVQGEIFSKESTYFRFGIFI